jgi:hypothetical protein
LTPEAAAGVALRHLTVPAAGAGSPGPLPLRDPLTG